MTYRRLRPVLLCVLWMTVSAAAVAKPLPRTIVSLYDSHDDGSEFYSLGCKLAEMPLNHLGFVVVHHDINQPLPSMEFMRDIHGVLMWIETTEMADPSGFLDWGERVLQAGKPFVILGGLPFLNDLQGRETDRQRVNQFLAGIGLRNEYYWVSVTYDLELPIHDSRIVGFERKLSGVLSPFECIQAIGSDAKIFLQARRRADPDSRSDLIVVTDNGAYAAARYTHFTDIEEDRKQWILNPFAFFRAAFSADQFPKPDTTTLSGRRLYYSHIDGDGWRSVSQISPRTERQQLSCEIILRQVLLPFADLPVTVAPVAGDLHPDWFGSEAGRNIAREIFRLPHVEVGSHTFSHPLDWQFFETWSEEKERPYLAKFKKHWGATRGRLNLRVAKAPQEGYDTQSGLEDYDKPRAYAVERFTLEHEIRGSVRYIESLLPAGKRVALFQWSGNTQPFEAALQVTQDLGIANINGGDTRFDRTFASVAWVSPVGRLVGNQRQIYASNSNENTYTDLWTDRFFGFMHLVRTFQNTATPLRLKPLNVYYHMYSGEKLSSLNALLANLNYARGQEICPVTTARYATIADGFYTTQLDKLGKHRWEISERGALQTIRFDHATFQSVDFARSHGVLGQRHSQGSLYVALDKTESRPVIALRECTTSHEPPADQHPYLIQARWDVWGLRLQPDGFRFDTAGYGKGQLQWKVPNSGTYEATIHSTESQRVVRCSADADGILRMDLGSDGITPLTVNVRRVS